MTRSSGSQPSLLLVVLGSYALAFASTVLTAVTWIEGIIWLGLIGLLAWLSLVCWAFARFGALATWTLLGFLIANPLSIFWIAITYACAFKSACF